MKQSSERVITGPGGLLGGKGGRMNLGGMKIEYDYCVKFPNNQLKYCDGTEDLYYKFMNSQNIIR